MIEISLATAVLFYGVIIALAAGFVWLFTEFSAGRTYTVLEKQHMLRCSFCTYTYLDNSGRPISRCPRCQSFNTQTTPNAPSLEPVPELAEEGALPRRNPSHRKRPGAGRRGPRRHR